jgi:hypothetical protein
VKLAKNETGFHVAQLRYSQIIESLMYLANCTRPDISYPVTRLAGHTQCPDKTHWKALNIVLLYWKGTISLELHYLRYHAVLEGYSDASWIANNFGSYGCTGYVFTLGCAEVACRST